MKEITIKPIGRIITPHNTIDNMPIQPSGAKGITGIVEISPEYAEGLMDIDGFSHLILLYHFHKVEEPELVVKPFMDTVKHGIFATRSPKRPSKVGISIVKLLQVDGNKLLVEGVDMLNDSPLIDVKPFFRQTDNRPDARSGWLDKQDERLAEKMLSDDRFA